MGMNYQCGPTIRSMPPRRQLVEWGLWADHYAKLAREDRQEDLFLLWDDFCQSFGGMSAEASMQLAMAAVMKLAGKNFEDLA
jgi:hypothetical protein